METLENTGGRPVEIYRNGSWLPGAIIEINPQTMRARVRYTTKAGNERFTTVTDPDGDGTMVLTRGSTVTGTAVTGKRFPRDAKNHVCASCRRRLPGRKFPTDGPEHRLGECRRCRDERTPSGMTVTRAA